MTRQVAATAALAALLFTGAAAAAAGKTFRSERHGYALVLPAGWSVTEPPGRWSGTPYPGSAGVDTYSGPVPGRMLLASSRPVTARMTLQKWAAGVIRNTPPACGRPETNVAARLGGEPARRFTNHCSDGYYLINVVALHRGRGYVFISASAAENDRRDRIVFGRALRTWRFTR